MESIRHLLRRVLRWLLRKLEDSLMSRLTLVATTLVAAQERENPDTSGEYKRHQVYAKMLKTFPAVRRRDIGLAIELAIQEQV